jgi:secondary thiamine-phosphate synthase enzyme
MSLSLGAKSKVPEANQENVNKRLIQSRARKAMVIMAVMAFKSNLETAFLGRIRSCRIYGSESKLDFYSLLVFINDDESGLHHDYDVWLEKLAPHDPVSQYRHNVGEDNADAHMKRQIMGREVVVAVTNGHLDFGTWEQIIYGEFDGRRRKRVLVKIIGE